MSGEGERESQLIAGRYQLHDLLGRGGMADVYRATDQVLDRQVAVKVLRAGTDDDSARARFVAETRLLAQLSHPGLVMLLDGGVDIERSYLVMELVNGATLASKLSAGEPLDVSSVRDLGAQLAEALAYAHSCGVVHRDVKPGNVLLGSDGRIRLADFGIARLIGDTVRHTLTGQAIGTAAYLAPEQVRGEAVDGAADVYSLGLVLLEALTGRRAYPGPSTESAMARLTRPPSIPPDLDPALRDPLVAMTALDPAERPPAAQIAAQLQGAAPAVVQAGAPPARDPGLARRSGQGDPEPATPTLVFGASTRASVAGVPPGAQTSDRDLSSYTDRAGEAIERTIRNGFARLRGLPQHQQGVLAALLALLLLIVIVAIASNDDATTPADLPRDIPPRLEQPLSDLHQAVHGD